MMVKIYFYGDLLFQHFVWCPLRSICYSIFFKPSKLIISIFELFQPQNPPKNGILQCERFKN